MYSIEIIYQMENVVSNLRLHMDGLSTMIGEYLNSSSYKNYSGDYNVLSGLGLNVM